MMNFTRKHHQNRFRFADRRTLFSIWARNDPSSNRSPQLKIVEQPKRKAFTPEGMKSRRQLVFTWFEFYIKNRQIEVRTAIYTLFKTVNDAGIRKRRDGHVSDRKFQLPDLKNLRCFSLFRAGLTVHERMHCSEDCGNRKGPMTSATAGLWQKSGDLPPFRTSCHTPAPSPAMVACRASDTCRQSPA